MSNKFDSMIIILNKLESKEHMTVYSLMNDLEMKERTIYRYIQTLNTAGFPIIYDRKRNSYAFEEGFSLRKPNLSVEESLALALSQKLLKSFGMGIEGSLKTIEDKLSIKNTRSNRHIVLLSGDIPLIVGETIVKLHGAILNNQKIDIVYNALHSEELSSRKLNPYYLFFYDGFWYVRGFCYKSESFRTFGLDRIVSLNVLDEHFLPKPIVPEEELSSSFGTWLDGKASEVVLVFDKEIKQQVLRKKWHPDQKVKELPDGGIEMRLPAKGMGGIKKWIYQWIPFVNVKAPRTLASEIKNDLNRVFNKLG